MRSLRFFWSYISYRKGLLALMMSLAAVVAATELYIPWLIMLAIDSIIDQGSVEELDLWALEALGLLAIFYVLHYILGRVEAQAILSASYNLRRRLYTHIVTQGLPFFQRYRTGELIHRVVNDAEIFEEEAADLFSDIPFDFLTVIGVMIFMAILDWELALFITAFMLVSAVIAGYLGRPLLGIEKSLQSIGARLAARLQENIVGIRTVQGFQNEELELSKFDVDNRKMFKTELKEGKIEAFMEPMADLLTLLGLVLVVWYGGHLIIVGELTVGGLVAFIAYMEILSDPLGDAEGYYRDYLTCRAMADRLQELMDDEEEKPASGSQKPEPGEWRIVAERVSFRHANSQRDILKDISFTIEPGETIAIVGRNGAGKSTLLDLLLRFYDPGSGTIKAGGFDLREWDLKYWRESIGVMSQDVFLFQGTILENIGYGRPDATPEEVEEAARTAGVDRLAKKLPNGYETIVGERGTQLSGGERQRVALARLFLRNPRILILDEPTAHLDGEALQFTILALRKLMAGCVTFIVTHQSDMVEMADRVLFFDQGNLVGDGTHQTLLAENSSYEALWMDKRPPHIMKRRVFKRDQRKRRSAKV